MYTIFILQLLTLGVMILGLFLVFEERRHSKRGIGARSIQLIALILLAPSIVILSLAEVLKPDTTGTLLAALIGYILSGVARRAPKKSVPQRGDDE